MKKISYHTLAEIGQKYGVSEEARGLYEKYVDSIIKKTNKERDKENEILTWRAISAFLASALLVSVII